LEREKGIEEMITSYGHGIGGKEDNWPYLHKRSRGGKKGVNISSICMKEKGEHKKKKQSKPTLLKAKQ